MEEAALGSRRLHLHRQLLAGADRVPLGKRALELLSMLAEARGRVVTKDELLEAVWPGTIVEDNAIQAQVVALRRALGTDANRLKTVRGIGYRLDTDDAPAAVSVAPEPGVDTPEKQTAAWSGRRIKGSMIAAFIVVAGAALTALVYQKAAADDVVEVTSFAADGGPQALLLAHSLDGEVVNVLNRAAIPTRDNDSYARISPSPRASRRLSGTVLQNGRHLSVDMQLQDGPSGTVLWSRRFEGDAALAERLALEASVAAARTLYTVEELNLQKGIAIDPEVVALQIRGSDLVRSAKLLDEATPRKIYEEIVARVPRLAHGHAMLSLTLTSEARRSAPDKRAALLAQARREADRAIAIDPAGAGAAYDAYYFRDRSAQPHEIGRYERWILEGTRKAPGFAFLWMRECRILTEVGRARDALTYCQRALAQHPYAEPIGHSYARALWATGDYTSAEQTILSSAELAPDHSPTRTMRFELAAFGGQTGEARKLLDDPATRPPGIQDNGLATLRSFLGPPRPARQTLAARFQALGRSGAIPIDWAVMALASMGENDDAFDLLGSPRLDERLDVVGSAFLFQPVTRGLRADRRFWTTAAKLGLVSYWQVSGKWPDMCGKEVPLAHCKSEAKHALGL